MFRNSIKILFAALTLTVIASTATAQGAIPIRYSATSVQMVQLPYQVTKVDAAADLGSDLFRIWIPGYLAVATAPNEHFDNWGGSADMPRQFQMTGTITVQGVATPMVLMMPGHLHGVAALPGNVAVGSSLILDVETRDVTGAAYTGHKLNINFLRTK